MRKLYLTRHGETRWNVEKRFQGQLDIELNENGIEQARKLKEDIANFHIDLVFSSPSKRALATSQIAMEGRDVPIVTDARLMEMKLGDWEGCFYDEVHQKFGKDSEDFWNNPSEFNRQGVETFKSILERTRAFLNDILLEDGTNFLIISHGLTTRALTAPFDNRGVANFWERDRLLRNCGLIEMEIDTGLTGRVISWGNEETRTLL